MFPNPYNNVILSWVEKSMKVDAQLPWRFEDWSFPWFWVPLGLLFIYKNWVWQLITFETAVDRTTSMSA